MLQPSFTCTQEPPRLTIFVWDLASLMDTRNRRSVLRKWETEKERSKNVRTLEAYSKDLVDKKGKKAQKDRKPP